MRKLRVLWDFLRGYKLHILGLSLLLLASLRSQPKWMTQGDSDVTSKSSANSTASHQEEEPEDIVVEGAVSVTSKTDPPFAIWLFPPDEDIISRKINAAGLYEPEETLFVRQVVEASSKTNGGTGWAMDIGTNIGFHSLHMAALGMHVISLEPSPDTASLLRKSVQANGFDHQPSSCSIRSSNRTSCRGSVCIVQAAAAATPGVGRLLRHPQSAGMTILQRHGDSSDADALPFGVENVIQDDIELVRPGDILSKTIGASPNEEELWLLKVDAEGYELHALKGADLATFPFRYLTFEFFPELLVKAGKTDPLDLLLYIYSFGYACGTDPASVQEGGSNSTSATILHVASDIEEWYNRTAVPAHQKSSAYHINMFCTKKKNA